MLSPAQYWVARAVLALGLTLTLGSGAREAVRHNELAEAPSRPPRATPSSPRFDRVSVLHSHPQLAVPTFVFASAAASEPASAALRASQSAVAVSRGFLADFAPLYGLSRTDAANAEVAGVHDTGFGPIIVSYRQRVAGVEVFRERLNVVLSA